MNIVIINISINSILLLLKKKLKKRFQFILSSTRVVNIQARHKTVSHLLLNKKKLGPEWSAAVRINATRVFHNFLANTCLIMSYCSAADGPSLEAPAGLLLIDSLPGELWHVPRS